MSGANFAYNKNTVKSLGYGLNQVTIVNPFATENQIPNTTVAAVGKPYGQIQTTDWNRSPSGQIIVDPSTGNSNFKQHAAIVWNNRTANQSGYYNRL